MIAIMTSTSSRERRISARMHVRLTACLVLGDQEVGGVLHDVSATGALLEVGLAVDTGCLGLLRAEGIDGSPPVRVVRKQPLDEGRIGLGLEFVHA
jgi:hypothetical protein